MHRGVRPIALVGLLGLGLGLGLGASGCKDGDDPCEAYAHKVAAELRTEDREFHPFELATRTLAVRTDLPWQRLRYAPAVDVTAAGLRFERGPLEPGTLTDLVDVRFPARRRPQELHLVIDAAAPWRHVVAAVDEARAAGFAQAALVFETPRVVTPPPKSAVDAELDALMREAPENRAPGLAKIATRLASSCEPMRTGFGQVAEVEGESKAETMIRVVEEGMIACRCFLDVASVRTMMWRLLHAERTVRVLVLDLTAEAAGPRIAAPADARWGDVQARLAPTTTAAQLVVE